MQLKEVDNMGKALDTQKRTNTRKRRGLFRVVTRARKAAFNGFKVSGSRIEKLMEGQSRVPVNVGERAVSFDQGTDCRIRTHL